MATTNKKYSPRLSTIPEEVAVDGKIRQQDIEAYSRKNKVEIAAIETRKVELLKGSNVTNLGTLQINCNNLPMHIATLELPPQLIREYASKKAEITELTEGYVKLERMATNRDEDIKYLKEDVEAKVILCRNGEKDIAKTKKEISTLKQTIEEKQMQITAIENSPVKKFFSYFTGAKSKLQEDIDSTERQVYNKENKELVAKKEFLNKHMNHLNNTFTKKRPEFDRLAENAGKINTKIMNLNEKLTKLRDGVSKDLFTCLVPLLGPIHQALQQTQANVLQSSKSLESLLKHEPEKSNDKQVFNHLTNKAMNKSNEHQNQPAKEEKAHTMAQRA
ncbi:hypothetical protein ACTNBL_01735 [Enterococcus villorum]|uniref:Uncharacterized protein n=2 Tax=Enterococcus villorum TaxID=112904 RepID=A0A511J2U2_9ENTE|nr:hypothetical protein [Enterococcus villorum]EOH92125.1 hypothetical protein UAO_00575 [Enterococcus villorum ATCC 700913]EOW76621.1 hypothetical protein I591_01929 [Enterococcus villorum ATCC 700913]GEL92310.1 hypothetical protein EVI01_16470 [Enterococcus villorum]